MVSVKGALRDFTLEDDGKRTGGTLAPIGHEGTGLFCEGDIFGEMLVDMSKKVEVSKNRVGYHT
jgi:hypothetical protein